MKGNNTKKFFIDIHLKKKDELRYRLKCGGNLFQVAADTCS